MRYTIKTPEGTFRKEGYMLAFANARKFGTGVYLSLRGSLSDGRFEICNFQEIQLEELINLGLTKFDLFLDEEMYSDVISCREAEIEMDRKVDFQIDGEYIGKVDRLFISTVESAVRVIVSGG
jgi:diacylglycerol kinase family enzyme